MKKIFSTTIAAAVLTFGLTGCVNDLDISSIDPQTKPGATDMELLAKCYSTLGLTGQRGPAGNADLAGIEDEGESGFYRTTFNCQELMTDECAWAWQDNPDIAPFTMISWNSGSVRTQWVYTRLTYDITLFNSYLSQVADNEANSQYRAEVRFLRALNYWYLLDLFGKAPFKTEFNITDLPVEYSGEKLYEWLDQELTEIEPLMAEPGSFCNTENFGRADRGAAYMLHARLALNSEVYTKGKVKDYQKAIDYCDLLIGNSTYGLSTQEKNGFSGYQQLFMADNDENPEAMKEIIFPIRQDGQKTRCHSGAMYVVNSMRAAGMPNMGTTNGWQCLFARRALIQKFFPNLSDCPISTEAAPANATEEEIMALDEQDGSSTAQIIAKAGDKRALFYAGRGGGIRTLYPEAITAFTNGLSIVKWDNHRSDLQPTHDQTEYPDVDLPLFRLAEAYLTRAEAKYRLDDKHDLAAAQADIDVIRNRAGAAQKTITSEEDILDEWCREFYVEGRRRSDLVRFGVFTGSKYLWDWKGGAPNGTYVHPHFNVFPIPYDECLNNTNMTQNEGY